jgi:hypothetical protein
VFLARRRNAIENYKGGEYCELTVSLLAALSLVGTDLHAAPFSPIGKPSVFSSIFLKHYHMFNLSNLSIYQMFK